MRYIALSMTFILLTVDLHVITFYDFVQRHNYNAKILAILMTVIFCVINSGSVIREQSLPLQWASYQIR